MNFPWTSRPGPSSSAQNSLILVQWNIQWYHVYTVFYGRELYITFPRLTCTSRHDKVIPASSSFWQRSFSWIEPSQNKCELWVICIYILYTVYLHTRILAYLQLYYYKLRTRSLQTKTNPCKFACQWLPTNPGNDCGCLTFGNHRRLVKTSGASGASMGGFCFSPGFLRWSTERSGDSQTPVCKARFSM